MLLGHSLLSATALAVPARARWGYSKVYLLYSIDHTAYSIQRTAHSTSNKSNTPNSRTRALLQHVRLALGLPNIRLRFQPEREHASRSTLRATHLEEHTSRNTLQGKKKRRRERRRGAAPPTRTTQGAHVPCCVAARHGDAVDGRTRRAVVAVALSCCHTIAQSQRRTTRTVALPYCRTAVPSQLCQLCEHGCPFDPRRVVQAISSSPGRAPARARAMRQTLVRERCVPLVSGRCRRQSQRAFVGLCASCVVPLTPYTHTYLLLTYLIPHASCLTSHAPSYFVPCAPLLVLHSSRRGT
jgi:hypothetical protein